MTSKYERCVRKVKKQKGYNPYAVCRASLKKKVEHDREPLPMIPDSEYCKGNYDVGPFQKEYKKMPDGWVHIEWKDGDTKRVWTANVPESLFNETKTRIIFSGGQIIKIVR